ncbi:MAG: rRNA pseudouridine synthase, partial [Lachnospiraceae bacterium]|nr:rRNA pseudouridine synthase [Lachnospiraceae bacterium]
MAEIRLDKFLADAGAGTRSTVKIMVKKGRVSVNGEIVKKSDIKVNPEKDVICLDGKKLTYNEFEFFMLNKPQGVISATTDTKDKTVIELITEAKRRDLFPVGRLDKDTEGLLIITNDGKLANNLLAPGKHVEKKYFARVEGLVTD